MTIVQSQEGSAGPITRSLSARLVVLIVEESKDEAARITSELERSGYTVAAEHVCTPQELAAALDKSSWDVVISSARSASVDGVAVVQALRERQLETPVVLLSDGSDEVTNLESIAAGAEDVLKREDLYRLPYVVGRILQHQQIRQDQAAMLRTARLRVHRRRGFGIRRVLAVIIATLLLTLMTLGFWYAENGRIQAEARLHARVEEGASAVALLVQQLAGDGSGLSSLAGRAQLQASVTALGLTHDREIQVLESGGRIIADSSPAGSMTVPLQGDALRDATRVLSDGQPRTIAERTGGNPPVIYRYALPIQAKSGRIIGAVLVNYTTERVELDRETGKQVLMVRLVAGTAIVALMICLALIATLYLVLPIERLRDAAARLSSGSLDIEMPRGPGEIGDIGVGMDTLRKRLKKSVLARQSDMVQRLRAEEALRQVHLRLRSQIEVTQSRAREFTLLAEMGALLQACATREESYRIISRFAGELFADFRGTVYLSGAVGDLFEPVAKWGSSASEPAAISAVDCWALRRGQVHAIYAGGRETRCGHTDGQDGANTLCVPLMAQASAIGVLCMRELNPGVFAQELPQALAEAVSEQISLSLGNLMLREELRALSNSDPLTELYNRRYLLQTLTREVQRAEREKRTIGMIVADIDFFKRINDTFGHDGGDALLKSVARQLQSVFRGSDIACRLGGEEFAVMLPGASYAITQQRAEELRRAVAALHVVHLENALPRVSLSCGVAIYPDHGTSAEALLRAADQALYRAKERGRDRVESAVAA